MQLLSSDDLLGPGKEAILKTALRGQVTLVSLEKRKAQKQNDMPEKTRDEAESRQGKEVINIIPRGFSTQAIQPAPLESMPRSKLGT